MMVHGDTLCMLSMQPLLCMLFVQPLFSLLNPFFLPKERP